MLIHDRGALGHGAGEDHHQGEDEQHHQERDAALPIITGRLRVSKTGGLSPAVRQRQGDLQPCGSLCGRSQVSCQRPSA